MAVNALDRYRVARLNAYRWRYGLSPLYKVGLAVGMAGVTGLLAQARVLLPWTPVPITGQTFAVLLAGVLLGRWWGGVSMGLYAVLGGLGVPWFTGWAGGWGQIAGPTGGYIIGFVLAALVIGHLTDKYIRSRSFVTLFGLMLVANFVLIYLPGLLQLHLWLTLVSGKAMTVTQTLMAGAVPFIAGDVVKAAAAAVAARGITPRQSYNAEADRDRFAKR